jgi:UDPglucose 6-dehydrogenase
MNVCVLGLSHLGSVTCACLAKLGNQVTGLDYDAALVSRIRGGSPPIYEPGLQQLIEEGLESGRLRFTAAGKDVPRGVDVLWVAIDTPVGEQDAADTDFVEGLVARALAEVDGDYLVVLSAQMPVGTARRLERIAATDKRRNPLRVACCPENLRLGSALRDFLEPQRVVIGIRSPADKALLNSLMSPTGAPIEWMTVESAEMTKHALNAFLAASVTFANEVAAICERVGADAKQVERGLKSDQRIGARAYLAPGSAFAGGTLGRDVRYLNQLAADRGVTVPLLAAIGASNSAHQNWERNKLSALFSTDLARRTVALWGLTYKAGTDTLRRSPSVALGDWLLEVGAALRVHDPIVQGLPAHWQGAATCCSDPLAAVQGADALVVVTYAPAYHAFSPRELVARARSLAILDANRLLPQLACPTPGVRYFSVGMPEQAP